MKKLIKKIITGLGLQGIIRPFQDYFGYPSNATVLVHIGKCGGRTLRMGLKNAVSNTNVNVVHIRKPVYRSDLNYILIARNPIERLDSAFRWRYKLVVTDGVQKNRFKGEYNILLKYGSLNTIAESLYNEDGSANKLVQKEIRKIHHIYEDIAFYLDDLLRKCHPNQIIHVLMQENLNEDIYRVFGYQNDLHENKNTGSDKKSDLSERARRNLMRFFSKDYQALTKLYTWGKIDRAVFIKSIQ